jgi:oxalate---CoA ligase
VRRGRFQWNRDYDELARDASTIIRARCRDGPRIDWAALEQVFPAVPRNSVRQRIVALKEIPGAEAYLKRLEDMWYDLWLQHRGTENLPDGDPQSPSKFDLISHVEFLRRHIDKNAMYVLQVMSVFFFFAHELDRRVGFVVRTSHIKLPVSIDEVAREWEIVEKANTGPVWEVHWNALVDEGREKNLLRHPFTAHASDIPTATDVSTETVYLAESVVKVKS